MNWNKEINMDTFEILLTKLNKAVSYRFVEDVICPGVLFSTLKNGTIYASVVRYGREFDNGKLVVCKVKASDHMSALIGLTQEFLSENSVQVRNPLDELTDFVEEMDLV